MKLRLLSFICTVTAAAIVVSCGGGAMSGGADSKKDKKTSGAESASDEDATDPAIIAGAYLTCDYTSQAKSEVGCAVQNKGTNIIPAASERIDYVTRISGRESAPKNPSKNGDQVVLTASDGVNPSTISRTKFLARLIRSGMNVKEWSCDGANLPCKPVSHSLTGLNGYWEGSNTELYTTGEEHTMLGRKTGIPAPADDFCNSAGMPSVILTNVQRSVSVISGFSNAFTPPKPNNTPTLPRPYCVKKINGALIRSGNNCSVVVFKPTQNSKAHDVLVYPKDISETSQKELAGLNFCP
jgi:hypothetical protein